MSEILKVANTGLRGFRRYKGFLNELTEKSALDELEIFKTELSLALEKDPQDATRNLATAYWYSKRLKSCLLFMLYSRTSLT